MKSSDQALGTFSCFFRFLIGVLALLLMTMSPFELAVAQTSADSFCYRKDSYTTPECFVTLDEAEEALRSALLPVHRSLVRLAETRVDASGKMSFRYEVPSRSPATLYGPSYSISGCSTPTEDPYRPGWCSYEAIDETVQRLSDPQCAILPYTINGDYYDPYRSLDYFIYGDKYIGNIYYGYRTVSWEQLCSDGTKRYRDFGFRKEANYECDEGFSPGIDIRPPPLVSPAKYDLSNVCSAVPLPELWITTEKIKQVASCPANGNPCHPATGDKSRAETDFIFGNRAFTRYYHSLKQFRDKSLGVGWTHTYTERIGMDSSGAIYLITADGHYESAKPISTSLYRLENSPDRVLEIVSGGQVAYRLISSDGETKEFGQATSSSSGKLLSIRNPKDPSKDVELKYDSNGDLLKEVIDASGRPLRFLYEVDRLQGVSLPDGTIVSYDYDSDNNLVVVDYGDDVRKQYFYHEPGLSDPVFRNYLTGISYEDGYRYASFGYDSIGRVISSQLHGPNGYVERTTLNYNTADKVTVTTPSGGTRVYTLQPGIYRRPLSVSGGPDAVINTYEADGRLKTRAYANGTTSSFVYQPAYQSSFIEATGTPFERRTNIVRDAGNRLTRKELYSGQTLRKIESRAYSADGREIAACLIDPAVPGAADYSCGSQGNAPAGVRQTRTTYCEQADITAGTCPLLGLVTSVDGPRVDVVDITTYAYYPSDDAFCATTPTSCPYRKGDLWKVTNVLGQVTETLQYDGAGRALSVRGANGVIIDLEYHPRGWLTARKIRGANNAVETDDLITRIEYWPTGLAKKVTQPDGAFTAYTYDTAHRLTQISDNAGNKIVYTLDNAGNRTKEDTKDPAGTLKRTLSRIYNQLSQLQTQKDALNNATGFTYDAAGNTDVVTDALGRKSDNDYDPLNRLTRSLQNVGGIAAETKFAYDALDNLTQVTDPKGLNTTYTTNGLGDLTQLTSPDTGVTGYTYDSAGNRKTQTDARGITATYSYDALSRLTAIGYPTTTLNQSYAYDASQSVCASGETFAQGRLVKLTDASGTTQYCYDRFGNLVRKVQTTNAKVFTVSYAYTLGGRLSSVIYPDGASTSYTRNAQGQITQVNVTPAGGTSQILLKQASYAPFGPATGWTYGNNRVLTRTYNQNYQPITILDSISGGLNLGFQYDAVGNLTTLNTATATTKPIITFGYDALNRLTQTKDGKVAIETYAYDKTGNRQSLTTSTGAQAYVYPAANHRLSSVAGIARTYDAAGNTTQIGGTAKEFVYNAAGRLEQVKQGSIVKQGYAYNAKGEQVRKYLDTANSYTVYDEAGHWLGDYDTDGAPTQQAIWLDDLPVGLLAGASIAQKLHYIEPDHLGTPRAVIEQARNVAIWTWDLKGEVFGNSPPSQNPDGDATAFIFNMRFPGQRYDANTGLNYNYFRNYDTGSGRYAESDPIGLKGGWSTYLYTSGNPLLRSDALGLRWTTAGQYEGKVNTIVCDGAGGIEPAILPVGPSAKSCGLYDCVVAHEQSHASDALRSNARLCAGKQKGTQVRILGNETRRQTEIDASNIEIQCLKNKLMQNKCGPCDEIINNRIERMENYRDSF